MPPSNAPIIIQNEPQILPDQEQEAPITPETTREDMPELQTWVAETIQWAHESAPESVSSTNAMVAEIAAEIVLWNLYQGVWESLISDELDFFSWVLSDLDWDVVYNVSGDMIGSIVAGSWTISLIDLSGVSLDYQALSTIYPNQHIQINTSWYFVLDSLSSVTTTWWKTGVTYCSRISNENISALLKAWIRTWRETNQYVIQWDTDRILEKAIDEKTAIEVKSGDMQKIFTEDFLVNDNQIYDIYITFLDAWEKIYHRITFVHAYDYHGAGRYVLDPLRGLKTIPPQKIWEYLGYYADETDVRRYIGQWYTPLLIRDKFTIYGNIEEAFPQIFDEEIWIGELLTWENIHWGTDDWNMFGENNLSWEISTWEVFSWRLSSGDSVPWEIFSWEEKLLTWTIVIENLGEISTAKTEEKNPTIQITTDTEEINIDTQEVTEGYFTKSYKRGEYSPKITELQKLLNRMDIYSDTFDGIYSDMLIESVYQYQLFKNILTPQSPIGLRWYLGPTTRSIVNQSYGEYQIHILSSPIDGCKKDDVLCRIQKLEEILSARWYTLTKKWLVRLSQDAMIGSESLNMNTLENEFIVPIVLQSTNQLSWQIAEVQLPKWTIIKTVTDEDFVWEIAAPKFVDAEAIQNDVNEKVIAAIDVWSDKHVQFEDGNGNALYATFRVPAPGVNIGDTIDINYSHDGQNWIYLDSVEIQEIDGEPYAIFEANHFTTFYLWNTTGTFTINNDAIYATWLAVTLNNTVPWATHMRFGNSIAERDAAGWSTYTATRAWTLSWVNGDGIKRVYAQFSGNEVVRNVSDSIIYDTSSANMAAGLLAWLDGSYSSTTFYDIWWLGYNFTASAAGMNGNRSGEQITNFNGSRTISRATTPTISATPFTISAWVKPDRVTWNQGIVFRWRNNASTRYYGINLNATTFQITARNTTARTANGTIAAQAGKWYHIVGIFASNTSRTIYVDGVQWWTSTNSVTFDTTSPEWTIGKYPGTATNYLSGSVDEVRIYNRVLSAAQIDELYMIPPSFDTQTVFTGTPTLYGELPEKIQTVDLVINDNIYPTTGVGNGKWKTLPMMSWLADGTYNVTLNYTNVYGKAWTTAYTNWLVINSTWMNISYNPSTDTTWNVVATLTGLDSSYMIINNSWSELRTFTGNGSFVRQYMDKQGTTWSKTATVTWIKSAVLTYSTGIFYENSVLNNWSISWSSVATLSTGFFSAAVANYITMDNLPTGLTGVFTLSWTKQLIVTLSGNATNHASMDNTGNIVITFLTWAFSGMNPSDVGNTTQAGISVQFINPPGFIAWQQLRVDGTLSGWQFYDRSPNHRTTTIMNGTTSIVDEWETVMSFNGTNQYVSIWSYTLSNYSISTWVKSNSLGAWKTIVWQDGWSSFEMSQNTTNRINFYDVSSSISSTTVLTAGKWYHVVRVQSGTNTLMYINGVLEQTILGSRQLNNMALAIGKYSTAQYRDGNIDEVKIYDNAISASQVEELYMSKPSFITKSTQVASPNLRWYVSDPKMTISLTINGTNYPATNNQDGTRTVLAAWPFASGTYDVQLNYMNVYGKTGVITYVWWLTVNPNIYIIYTPSTMTSWNVIAAVTWYDVGTIVTNNWWSPIYIFTGNGQFMFSLQDIGGDIMNVTAIVDWIQKASLNYSTDIFYENTWLNNWAIINTMIVTLIWDTLSSNIITNGLVTMQNIPPGLTGVYTLSWTNQLIVWLNGNAENHTSAADINNISISFLTGAFSMYLPSQVWNSVKIDIAIDFTDGKLGSGTLRLDGSYNGWTQFYDLSESYTTRGYNGIGNGTRSWETVMWPFNGTNQYINVGNYNLSTYAISVWFNSSQLSNGRRTIIWDPGTSFEISQDTSNRIQVYGVITSNTTITANERYHLVFVRWATDTQLYINWVLDASNTAEKSINSDLTVGMWYNAQYRNGLIDEVHIYDTEVTAGQAKNLYLKSPSYQQKTEHTQTVVLTGLINDAKMYEVSVIVDWSTYPCTLQGDVWTSSSIWPLIDATYDVQLNYMNVYGRTGKVNYVWWLTVSDAHIYVVYDPDTTTSWNVTATITWYNIGTIITNNWWFPEYIFTGNGEFIFTLQNTGGEIMSVAALVDWIVKPSITFMGNTPAHNSDVTSWSFVGQINVINDNLSGFRWNRNNVSYPLYDSSLVAMYNFDNVSVLWESAGNTVADISHYGHTGSAVGPSWATNGKYNGAYSFDGNDYINLGMPWDLNFIGNADFTMSARVSKTSNASTHRPIICKWDQQYCLKFYTDEKMEMCVYDGGWQCAYSNTALNNNTRYHVVAK